jgi:phosphate starvation-inducible PhoH-like protein
MSNAERTLRRVEGIAITRLTSIDIVRHPLVARIVDAYDAARAQEEIAQALGALGGARTLPEPELVAPRTGLPKTRAPRSKTTL